MKRDSLAFGEGDARIVEVLLPSAAFPEKQSGLPSFLRGKSWITFPDGLNEMLPAPRSFDPHFHV